MLSDEERKAMSGWGLERGRQTGGRREAGKKRRGIEEKEAREIKRQREQAVPGGALSKGSHVA